MQTLRIILFSLLILLILSLYPVLSLATNHQDDLNYDIYQNQTDDLFIRIPPHFVLIAGEINIPLNITPKNGIFQLAYNPTTDNWSLIILSETEFNRLTLTPASHYILDFAELDGDGHLDLLIRSDDSTNDSFIVKQLTRTAQLNVYSQSRNNIDLSQTTQLTTTDINGDNIDDIIANNNGASITYLGSRSGQLVNTSATATYTQLGNIISTHQGQFKVSETGSASYYFPLQLPPATAGVIPNLGLAYNSQGGESILGIGWHLSGLSAINRCPKNIAVDGQIAGISFDHNDAYCYNGQRLLLNTGSSNQYHTEIDSFHSITAHPDNNNPSYFTLTTKNNETHYFGKAPALTSATDAYIERSGFASGTAAQVWALKAIIDSHGNYVRYDYHKDITKGSHYLSQVVYGGNHLLGKPTYNSVKFHYDDLSKSYISFSNGARLTHDKRLSKIQVKQDNDIYRSYGFTWSLTELPEERRYMTAIQECFDQNHQVCSPKTKFEFEHATRKTAGAHYALCTAASNGTVSCTAVSQCEPGAESNAEAWCQVSYQTADFAPFESGNANISIHDDSRFYTQILDFNGDGYADILFPKNNQWHYYTSHWDVNKVNSSTISEAWAKQYLSQYDTQRILSISNVQGKTQAISNASLGKKEYVKIIDLDGDGKQELLIPFENGHWHVISSDPSTGERRICETEPGTEHICFTTRVNYDFTYRSLGISSSQYANTIIADIDGDGLQDIVFKSGTDLHYYQNVGGNFSSPKAISLNFPSKSGGAILHQTFSQLSKFGNNTAMVDINADGLTDLILTVKKTTSNNGPCGPMYTGVVCPIAPSMQYSTQSSVSYKTYAFIASVNHHQITYTATNGTYLETDLSDLNVADFNGDGLTDVSYRLRKIWYYRLSKGNGSFTFRKALAGINATNNDIYSRHQFIDFNNDGRTDVLAATASRNYDLYLSAPSPNSESIHFAKRGMLPTGTHNDPNITSIRFADVDGDTKVDLLYSSGNSNSWKLHKATRANINEHVITRIIDSSGIKTDIAYAPLNSGIPLLNIESSQKPSVKSNYDYDDEPIGQEDGRDFLTPIAGMYLVSEIAQQTHNNHSILTQYAYGGPLTHKKGRGFLGFETIQITQPEHSLTTTTQYHQLHPFTGHIKNQHQRYQDFLLKQTHHTYSHTTSAKGGIQVKQLTIQEHQYNIDLSANGTTASNHKKVGETLTTNTHDNWHNLLSSQVLKKSSTGSLVHETFTTHRYSNSAYNAITPAALTLAYNHNQVASQSGPNLDAKQFSRLHTSQVKKTRYQHTANGQIDSQTRQTTLSYHPNGLLRESLINGLTTAYFYDKFGNKVAQQEYAKVNATQYQKRANYWFYDNRGQYIASKMNSSGEKEHYLYNGTSGNVATLGRIVSQTLTGPNKLATTQYFDIQGRTIEQFFANGNKTKIACSYCASCDKNYMTETSTRSNKPTKIRYIDRFGRERETKSKGFNGSWIVTTMAYNEQGQRTHISTPQFSSTSNHHHQSVYDKLGRVYRETLPSESNIISRQSKINGLTTTAIDENGYPSHYTYSPDGLLIQHENVEGQRIHYYYDAFNNQTKVTISAKNQAGSEQQQSQLFNVNPYGQTLNTNDPDKGIWAYQYNGFGEVIKQTNALGQNTLSGYDEMGRQSWREDNDRFICWYFTGHSNTHNVGKLNAVKQWAKPNTPDPQTHCSNTDLPEYSEQHHYDDFGRPKKINFKLDGTNYTTGYEYNAKGQLSRQYYPNNNGLFYINFYYNAYHYLYLQKDHQRRELRKIITMDAFGNITQQAFANGTQEVKTFNAKTGRINFINLTHGNQKVHQLSYGEYDKKGNLGNRAHSYYHQGLLNLAFNENFTYDTFNRLRTRQLSIGAGSLSPYGYSEQYQYDGFGNIKTRKGEISGSALITLAHYQYQQTSSAHRLKSAIVDGKGYSHFSYDNNGNILSDGHRQFTYYSFDKINTIQLNDSYSQYRYNPHQGMMARSDKRLDNDDQWKTYQTHYISNLYKKEQRYQDDTLEQTRHRYLLDNIIVERDEYPAHPSKENVLYQHSDHQGSNLTVTNQTGQVVEQYFYTAFGKPMKINNNKLANVTAPMARAYTDHEALPTLDIIHMGGRIYDPNLNRFLQADPSIQAPHNIQNYNRFSYVLNNPLRYTDPSGYNFFESVYRFLGKIDGREHSQKYVFQKNPSLANFTQTALTYIPVFGTLASAHFAFDRVYYASGSLRAAFKAGIISYVMAEASGSPEFSYEAIAILAIDNINPDVGRVGAIVVSGV
ncbi:toxin TcdB middle/N-terminal domain-containing protein [Shewanella surugensis]|uniref:FG-GAP-like repeat-containing protein n=1 Tax=Shewanella surugensis TaxID=212020 RepID=A0ABT0LFC0_9GAMM|nr:toxin TcdB middle/N-terminal domain-containing protein [Shewanella surugensis]MCL1125856.1 FG-GAP-like repeat-containing protein [Shewanella surugensis]